MRGAGSILFMGIFALSAAGCSSHLSSKADDKALLAKPGFAGQSGASADAELVGETAATYGDDQTAVKLFERSFAEHPTLRNEFNLASAYARTGRPQEAIVHYRHVAESGSREESTTESDGRRGGPETRVVLADEARRRLNALLLLSNKGRRDAAPMQNEQAARSDAANQPK